MNESIMERADAAKFIRLNLQSRLDELGWSRYRLAQESGESEQVISNIFCKETVPRIDVLANIAEALGMTVDDLISNPGKNRKISASRA